MSQLDRPAGGLTGRVTELDFLRGFFGQAVVSGGALVLTAIRPAHSRTPSPVAVCPVRPSSTR